MSEIEHRLDSIDDLIANVKPAEAERQLRSLLEVMGQAELEVWSGQIQKTIDRFLPKRRKKLTQLLQQRLLGPVPTVPAGPDRGVAVPVSRDERRRLDDLIIGFGSTLSDLSAFHIFQWSTYYRDAFRSFLDSSVEFVEGPLADVWQRQTHELIAEHSQEIFGKGRRYTERSNTTESEKQDKSLNGLERFTDLILEWYSTVANPSLKQVQGHAVRLMASTLIAGVVHGFSKVRMGEVTGGQLLGQSNRWITWVPFLTISDFLSLVDDLDLDEEATAVRAGCTTAMIIDRLVDAAATDFVPLPLLAVHSAFSQSLMVAVQTPPTSTGKRLDVRVVLAPAGWAEAEVVRALAGTDAIVLTTFSADLQQAVRRSERLASGTFPLIEGESGSEEAVSHVVQVVRRLLHKSLSPEVSSQPIIYNFATEFPLQLPQLVKHYYVVRTSVREMVSSLERRNGVRSWCSVRRSGKTTAALDVSGLAGGSSFISQTCDSTGERPTDSILYRKIVEAIDDGSQVAPGFLREAIRDAADDPTDLDKRIVLIIDEYETLFGQLRTAVDHNERLRYTVAQPVLNQFVEFARENLVVFMGQQPGSHNILMDQNQLSPYVEQIHFPLFKLTNDKSSEFCQLVSRVMSPHAEFDLSFAKRLHQETAGHPYLTVNMLVDFVDWLIERKTPHKALQFSFEDLSAFSRVRSRQDHIRRSVFYGFFRDNVAPHALSQQGKRYNPWLYSMYMVMRQIVRDNPTTLHLPLTEFGPLADELGLTELGFTADYLLNTGSQANFLSTTTTTVGPAIRLLGRIAAVSSPAVAWT